MTGCLMTCLSATPPPTRWKKVKTTNMGTLYELRYRITLRQEPVPKVFLDELRCRNGNLNITCCREETHESL